ncbi:hypothetical protein PVAP13_2NG128912 [Panicum virgatum]|uniref:Uncharacterized protein n=1 Tax=Panicum virgatum TaxID=38727 RepID=A0A8T0V8R5_PANVG|nr:hypothetical protein PVAP13_2NG128912 [Panicum virgatum]
MVEHVLRRLNPTGIREGEENDGFEWIKAAGAVAPPCPANSAAASSTLMEAYNASSSSVTLSVARTPRKWPSQTHNKEAALLTSMSSPSLGGPRRRRPACSATPPPSTMTRTALTPFRRSPCSTRPCSSSAPPPQSLVAPMPMNPAPAKSYPSPAAVRSEFRDGSEALSVRSRRKGEEGNGGRGRRDNCFFFCRNLPNIQILWVSISSHLPRP